MAKKKPCHGAKKRFRGIQCGLIWIQDGADKGRKCLFIFGKAFDEFVGHFVESAPANALEFIYMVDKFLMTA